ncbi:MAG: single-stranded-DNA-specific exonuclease RecJ [Patescibacteria group bacterium]
MKKSWLVPEGPSDNLLDSLMARRKIGLDQTEKFLAPNILNDLHDPFLLTDMAIAVSRLIQAIKKGERLGVFADYDADGVPGAAILDAFFRRVGYSNFRVYLPHRHEENYGLSEMAIRDLRADGVKLLLTVDCGIADYKPVRLAGELGMEVIVTDHHLSPVVLPPALAIINPLRPDDPYPFKGLCGTGVVFKLIQALITTGDFNLPLGWERWLLDLVAIATVSDLVPIVGENRALVHFGLRVLRRTPRIGLRRLISGAGLNLETVSEDDIGFTIGPRLNAASRMSHADRAYQLLTTTDPLEAESLARHLEEKNEERKAAVSGLMERLTKTADSCGSVLVTGGDDWPLGVLGLVASRWADKYRCPVFLWGRNGQGMIKGSCRSDGQVNVVELMRLAAMTPTGDDGLFLNIGGHIMAGGFSLAPDRLGELAPRLSAAHNQLPKNSSIPKVLVDAELSLEQINWDTHQLISRLSPFGVGNPKPIFLLRELTVGHFRTFGRATEHWSWQFNQSSGAPIEAVNFFASNDRPQLGSGQRVNLLANFELSTWRGRRELRLRVVDWEPAG